MKVLISGATGLIGKSLEPQLRKAGHDVNRLVRTRGSKACCDFYWDPYAGEIDMAALEGVQGVIHLSGENIAGRWTKSKKQRILESRTKTTSFLSKKISDLEEPPKVMVSASAIGYYGDRGNDHLTEKSKFGKGFLADVVRQWEAATAPAAVNKIRVVNLRLGVVLSKKGGALSAMLPIFKLGGGGIVGSGEQIWSWVSLEDVVRAFEFALTNDALEGPANVVAPNPVTNREFTKTLGEVLSRPTILPLPAFAAKVVLGEMADHLLLASAKVEAAKLKAAGFQFKHEELEPLLHKLLADSEPEKKQETNRDVSPEKVDQKSD